jgi:signal transduction histidine kinase
VVSADREILRRVLENLLDNSQKYAPTGGTIAVSARVVERGCVELSVTDDGPGIPPAHRERVFEKYFRVEEQAAAHARTSRGLGLTFCRVAVEAHGGRIRVEDGRPGGARFVITLPRR